MSLLFLNEDSEMGHIGADVQFAGEADELAQITEELHETFNATTMAMIRLESKAVSEAANGGQLTESTQTLVEAGVKEWFKKAADTIKEYWNKFVAWVKSVIDRVANFFTGADAFLRKNREALGKLSDADLKEVKFDRIAAVKKGGDLTSFVNSVSNASIELIKSADKESAAVADPNKAVLKKLSSIGKGDSISAIFKDGLLKVADKDATMTKKDVKTMEDILSNRKSIEGMLGVAKATANDAIKTADSMAQQGFKTNTKGTTSAGANPAQKTLANLRAVSGVASRLISGALSVAGSVASNARSGLNKAVSAAGKGEAKGDAKKEDGVEDILSQFAL